MCILQHGVYLRVILPRKGKEVQRVGIQVIRVSPCGKHVWIVVLWISCGTLHSRHGCRYTPTHTIHSRKIVPGRGVWDSPWTVKGAQERQEPTTPRNLPGPPRHNANSCTHATRVIIWLHDDASNSYVCGGHNYFVARVTEKNILSLFSNQLRHIFDDLYWAWIMWREKLGSSTVDKTTGIMWYALQIHEVMAQFSKYGIKLHPSITCTFSYFLITSKISEPLQDVS